VFTVKSKDLSSSVLAVDSIPILNVAPLVLTPVELPKFHPQAVKTSVVVNPRPT
jgi:hypothetical protein